MVVPQFIQVLIIRRVLSLVTIMHLLLSIDGNKNYCQSARHDVK